MKKTLFMIAGFCGLASLISGCSSFDQAVGRTKSAPDEFQVVVRPPLTLPPNFNLRPNNDVETVSEATEASIKTDAISVSDQVLTASRTYDGSTFDTVLGTDQRITNIRIIVDEETLGIQIDNRVPTDILFGGQPNVGPNLDAVRETIRIRRALEEGKPINEEATFATDPIEGTPLTIE